jgi:Glycosyl hydrolases family 2, TIM barrel domain/Glycosyl hydrolases family 2/Glycosyl hydrolases family 2, sugar binding domain
VACPNETYHFRSHLDNRKEILKTLYRKPHCGRSGLRILIGLALISFALDLRANAAVQFAHDFAPSESWVKPPEQPFRDDICLNGSWQFQPLALPANYREGVDPAPKLPPPTEDGWDKIPLRIPSTWNVNTFADQDGQAGDFRCYPSYPSAWGTVKMGWIHRTFNVPAQWKGRRVLIHFAAVAGDLQIKVNEKEADKRFDIFLPFDVDVTDLVKYGAANDLLVGVRKPELFDVEGKFGRRPYQAGSLWGQQVAGIWQDVDLVCLPPFRVDNVFVQPLLDQDILQADVILHNDSPTSVQVEVTGEARQWNSLAGKDAITASEPKWRLEDATALSLPSATVTIPAHGEKKITLQQKVASSLKFWTPEDPELYGLLIGVKQNGQPIDLKYTRFGWRQISLSGSNVLLNGKPLILKGDSWHFFGVPLMTRRYPWAWFTAMRAANLNAVRLHAEPYPEFYLDVADEMGILVLDETAIWASDLNPKLDSDIFWQDTMIHIPQLVMRDRNHPSVFGWSVCNEMKPVVQSVFHSPPGMYEKLLRYYPLWADTVRRLDPTRSWISADGDEDGGGSLPTYMIHYGDEVLMKQASQSGKPWGVGEASGAYYMTPLEVAKTYGERAYDSFEGRMEGIAVGSYRDLVNQRKYGASYRSVFNLVWYGLQPLPLGMADTTKPPTLQDGVFFPPFVEGQPGVQPERLGPYCTTLNPGYDPTLPLYRPWPLFEAIKDAQAEPLQPFSFPIPPQVTTPPAPAVPITTSLGLLSGPGGKLQDQLLSLGVDWSKFKNSEIPEVLFVDGINPPPATDLSAINRVLSAGKTVMVWGVDATNLAQLNDLLPAPLVLTDRKSASFVPDSSDPITSDLKLSQLYFCESSPPLVINQGLGGPLVEKSLVLLRDSNTDWMKWDHGAWYATTNLVFRSEQESKPSGAVLIEFKSGPGRLLVCNLPAESPLNGVKTLDRHLLERIGIPLPPLIDVGQPFLPTGELVQALAIGRFAADDLSAKTIGNSFTGETIRDGAKIGAKGWGVISSDGNLLDLSTKPLLSGPATNAVTFLSFWILSPRSLENLLQEPNVPKMNLNIQSGDKMNIWLNGKCIVKNAESASGLISAQNLRLHQGWNHFLIQAHHDKGEDKFSAKLSCDKPEFLAEIQSALQKP